MRYVDVNSSHPTAPYITWATAARVIQDAVGVATGGDELVVTNGVYRVGMTESNGRSRVVLGDRVVVRSVNGPDVTVIEGQQEDPQTGQPGVRCAFVRNGSVLSGFTLTGGSALGDEPFAPSPTAAGGGAYCEPGGMLTNCVITSNSAGCGGGVYNGALFNGTLSDNAATARGGGAAGQANGFSGGYDSCILYNCTLTGNKAGNGGGSDGSVLHNCLLIGNRARESGGGASASTLFNCTVVGNAAQSSGGGLAPGAMGDYANDYCIIYGNEAPRGANHAYGTILYSCTTPLPLGPGNITADPWFVDAGARDYRLHAGSPCLDAGYNADAGGATDLDGRPRIVGGRVDMGAYEYQGAGMNEFIAWLQRSNLPTDGSADTTDSDSDGLNNWQEWRCQTVPTDPLSVLRLLSVALDDAGLTLRWPSVAGVRYVVERSADLGAVPAFTPLVRELPGAGGTNTFTDSNAVVLPGGCYRVGVEERGMTDVPSHADIT